MREALHFMVKSGVRGPIPSFCFFFLLFAACSLSLSTDLLQDQSILPSDYLTHDLIAVSFYVYFFSPNTVHSFNDFPASCRSILLLDSLFACSWKDR